MSYRKQKGGVVVMDQPVNNVKRGIDAYVASAMIALAFIMAAPSCSKPKKPDKIIITQNQAGVLKIDGITLIPDSVVAEHYNYKGQIFEPSIKYYSIQH